MSANPHRQNEAIRKELETTRTRFHTLLASLSEQDFQRQSLNTGWTNGEILAHMTFGFIVINVLLPHGTSLGQIAERLIQMVRLAAERVYRSLQLVQRTRRPRAGEIFYSQANWKNLRPRLFFSREKNQFH